MKKDINFNITDIRFVLRINHPAGVCYTIKEKNCMRLVYILKGSAVYKFSEYTIEGKAGDMLLLCPGDTYTLSASPNEGWEFYVIGFTIDTPIDKQFAKHIIGASVSAKDSFQAAENAFAYKPFGYKLHIKGLLYTCLYNSFYDHTKPSYSVPIDKAVTYILTHFGNPITVRELAAVSGYSTSYFGSEFLKYTGMSPMKYINHIRIEKAKELIVTGLFSMSEISEKCGFENMYYFSNVFKKYTGVSPSKFW